VPHQRFSRELRVEQPVKKGDHLVTVHRSVQVGRNRGHVNPLAKVVVAAVLQTLEKYGHTLLRRGLPVLIDQPPEVVGQGVLLGKCHVDHRQRGTLALIDAGEKKWDDGVFHVSSVKVRWNGGPEPGECRRKIRRCGAGCRGRSGESGAGNKASRAGSGPSQNRPSFHLDTPCARKLSALGNRIGKPKADPAAHPAFLFGNSRRQRGVGYEMIFAPHPDVRLPAPARIDVGRIAPKADNC
jgi:hypothetical protein